MDRERVAEECLRIEKHHGDVLAYLRGIGCISPWGTWYRIQREQLGRKAWQITNGKGVEKLGKAKLTLADKKEAVRIATEGGNPYNFLRSKGVAYPESTWAKIKKNITDPDVLAKIPHKLPDSVKEIPETATTNIETPEATVWLNQGYVAALEEKVDDLPFNEPEQTHNSVDRITAALTYMNRTVTAIVNPEFGEWHRKGDWIDWENRDGQIISMTIPEWKMFHHMMEDDFRILGVDLQ